MEPSAIWNRTLYGAKSYMELELKRCVALY